MKKVFGLIFTALAIVVLLPVIVGSAHLWGKKPEATNHSTVILIRNLTHIYKTLAFLILSGIFLIILWIQY